MIFEAQPDEKNNFSSGCYDENQLKALFK